VTSWRDTAPGNWILLSDEDGLRWKVGGGALMALPWDDDDGGDDDEVAGELLPSDGRGITDGADLVSPEDVVAAVLDDDFRNDVLGIGNTW